MLMRTAALQQTNLTEFVVRISVEAAQAAIEHAERLQLSQRDSLCVLGLLENPPPPNDKLLAVPNGYTALLRRRSTP